MTDPVDWPAIFDGDTHAPALELVERLAASRDLSVGVAQDYVYDAEDDGTLAEADAGGPTALQIADGHHDPVPARHGTGADDTDTSGAENSATDERPRGASVDAYSDVSFASADLAKDEWPAAHRNHDAWMCRKEGKAPWSPWTDPDAPVECSHGDHDEPSRCDRCRHSARFKWGSNGSREYVHTDFETAREWRDKHPGARADLAFIQRALDPFLFVDGDDVRDPETGEVYPGFLEILDRLGLTYTDVSQSDTGAHALYRGELPDGVKQVQVDLADEPFGANDDPPTLEIYGGKHVCIATGNHVTGTGLAVEQWDPDEAYDILDELDVLPRDDDGPANAFDQFDNKDYTPDATGSNETASDIRDVFAAIDKLDAQDVAKHTIVDEWQDSAGFDNRAFIPTWASPGYDGTANFANDKIWKDKGDRSGYGGPVCMAAIDAGLVSDKQCPEAVSGETWFDAVDHLRDLGYSIPELTDDATEKEAAIATPLARFDALDHDQARRYAKKREEWPSTREARAALLDRLVETIRHCDQKVLDAPTALGKSFTAATEPWLDRADVTGEAPVAMFHETREARDQTLAQSREANIQTTRLLGRSEACDCAAGDHDPARDEDDVDPEMVVTVDGEPASEWLRRTCDDRGLPLSVAHKMLGERCDQNHDQLPCEGPVDLDDDDDGGRCLSVAQWDDVPRDGEGEARYDVIHATHNFAHVPSLRNGTNMIFDERPDFGESLSHERVREMVAAFLDDAGAPVGDFERFIARARADRDERTANEHAEHAFVSDALDHQPDRDWYVDASGAHTLAPAVTRAIWYAFDGEDPDRNGRFKSTVPHDPPRLDEDASDDDGWNREYVSAVLDGDNTVRTLRVTPHTGNARSVVGLDAHPDIELWQRNVHPDIRPRPVLDPTERARWRRYERGLIVARVGDATRPLTSGEYFDEGGTRAFLGALRDQFGERWSTAITAASVERRTDDLMQEVGVDDPETMHFGEEKSRNDFADEDVGAVLGCIDPGDDYVLDLLAECDLDAAPETTDDGDRAHGRGFVGPDAEAAAALLASVRENHVAQAAGRYARNADDQDDRAVVFVRTDATPAGFVDVEVPGVQYVGTDDQRAIVDALRERPTATADELAEAADVTDRYVRDLLSRLADAGTVEVREGAGDHGKNVYRALAGLDGPEQVDLTGESRNDGVWGHYTFAFRIEPATPARTACMEGSTGPEAGGSAPTADARGSDPPK